MNLLPEHHDTLSAHWPAVDQKAGKIDPRAAGTASVQAIPLHTVMATLQPAVEHSEHMSPLKVEDSQKHSGLAGQGQFEADLVVRRIRSRRAERHLR